MAFFKRPTPVDFSPLTSILGAPARVLTHGVGDDGVVLAITPEELVLHRDGQWQIWRWEQVAGGSWSSETSTFKWTTMNGEKWDAQLTEENRVPEAFRERVLASTLVQSVVDASPRGQVQVIGRRDLSKTPETHWYAVPSGGADLNDPHTREVVVAETDRLRAEYF